MLKELRKSSFCDIDETFRVMMIAPTADSRPIDLTKSRVKEKKKKIETKERLKLLAKSNIFVLLVFSSNNTLGSTRVYFRLA
jgi:hypothetical protein